MAEDELLTFAKVAEETGYSSARLRQLAARGELPAKLYGKTWLIQRTDLEKFLAEHHPRTGRPRGSKNRPKSIGYEPCPERLLRAAERRPDYGSN